MDQYIGKLLDNRYELLDVIGVGGMAMVYKAYCHRLHRFVAVKILKRDLAADAELRRRFHDEAQAVAMLSHANIVSVYDVSHTDDLDYIVMELIDGITLKQYMKTKGGPLSWQESLHFITQIMRALDHAHGRGIIHRDIKPQNIMVLRDGSVKVADFGIARVMSAAQNTLTQEALGSVHYISPEQARGRRIDARADIYSAGVVLYEMLTGRLPFEGDSPVSVAIQHISATPIAPREINGDIPQTLETITLRAMSANIDRRYRSAADMIQDLEAFRKNPKAAPTPPAGAAGPAAPRPQGQTPPQARPPQADEPTQIVDTGSIRRQAAAQSRPGERPYEDDYDYEYDDPRPATRKKTLLPVIIVVALFLVGVGVFLYVTFFSDMLAPSEGATVPDLRGRSLAQVQEDATVTDQFTIVQSGTINSDEYERGEIVEQDPAPGEKLRGDRPTINVVVSVGKEYVTMPEVDNIPYQEAFQRITTAGLKVAAPQYVYDDEIEKDNVISSTPLAGSQLAPDTEVTLTVSLGAEAKPVMVPHLVGQTEARARQWIDELELTIGSVDQVNNDAPAGEVIWQSIQAQQEVEKGTTIDLQVSLGPRQVEQSVSREVPIQLPTDRTTVQVRVLLDEQVVYEGEVDTAEGVIRPVITGRPSQHIYVYFDGVLSSEDVFGS